MSWKFGSTATNWIFSSTNYEAAEGEFVIISSPTEIVRGVNFSVSATGVTQAPSSATLDGQPVEVVDYETDEIILRAGQDSLAGHGSGKTVSITVGGVTQTFTVNFSVPTGKGLVTLISPEGGSGTIYAGMINSVTSAAMSPVSGAQVIYDLETTPNLEDDVYPVEIDASGWPIIDTSGQLLDGTETFQFQYLVPGEAISNIVTITVADYVEGIVPELGANVNVNVDEGVRSVGTYPVTNGATGVTYSLSGPDAALFTISSSGFVQFSSAPSYDDPQDANEDNVYVVYVVATNVSGSDQKQLSITVLQSLSSQLPVMPEHIAVSIAEQGTTSLGSLGNATSALPLTYEIGGLDAALFNINSSTGAIDFKEAPDYETPLGTGGNTYYINRIARNSIGYAVAPQNITVNVTNIIDKTTPNPINFSVVLGAEPETVVTRTTAITGPEAGATLTATTFQLSNDGGSTWSSSVTYVPGQTLVRASVTSSVTPGNYVEVTGSVNGVTGKLRVFTKATDVSADMLGLIQELANYKIHVNLIIDLVEKNG